VRTAGLGPSRCWEPSAPTAAAPRRSSPSTRRLGASQVVTGTEAARYLDDRACGLGVVAMTSQLAGGDLGGRHRQRSAYPLAEHARHPRVLHTDQP